MIRKKPSMQNHVLKPEAQRYIRSMPADEKQKVIERFEKNIYYGLDGCWYWLGYLCRFSRGRFELGKYQWLAYQASYELFRGPILNGLFCCHHCDNGMCVNPHHIFLGTVQDNADDFMRKGRPRKCTKGERNSTTKLNNEQVLMIRELRGYLSNRSIAARFQVSESTISMIHNRKVWTHI